MLRLWWWIHDARRPAAQRSKRDARSHRFGAKAVIESVTGGPRERAPIPTSDRFGTGEAAVSSEGHKGQVRQRSRPRDPAAMTETQGGTLGSRFESLDRVDGQLKGR